MSRIHLSPPHMGATERSLLLDAFDSNWIAPIGPHIDAFEREMTAYLGGGHCTALSSGTAALHLALLLLDVGPGDEVWLSTHTFAASASAVRYCGAMPVFIDSEAASWTLDVALLQKALAEADTDGRLPKALMAVDLYGQCANYPGLRDVCDNYGIPIIADAAEALGARCNGRAAGTLGDLGVFSFNGNKIVNTSGGGMLWAKSEALAERARFLATQAREPALHYQHHEVGYNYRMSNLLAAVGRGQLQWLDERVQARRANNHFYREALGGLPGLSFMPEAPWSRATFWLTCVLVDASVAGVDRDTILTALAAADIEARPVWKPMHLQPAFSGSRVVEGSVAERLFNHGLCLPSGSNLSADDLSRISLVVKECWQQGNSQCHA